MDPRIEQVEPVKVPRDDDLFAIHDEYFPTMVLGHDNYLRFARALLARYGQPVEPKGWKLVPVEPTEGMLEGTESYLIDPDGEPVDIVRVTKSQYQELLAAAPKFGEDE